MWITLESVLRTTQYKAMSVDFLLKETTRDFDWNRTHIKQEQDTTDFAT